MSPKNFINELNDIEDDCDIAIYTMEYLEIKKNRKAIIKSSLKELQENNKGEESYHYFLDNKENLQRFKNNIKEHFKYIINHCNKPLITDFENYKGEIDLLNAYCQFYENAITFINLELKNKKLIKDNLEKYFIKIKEKLNCP